MKNNINYFFFILVIYLSINCNLFAQEKHFKKHTVIAGETVFQISQKYKIPVKDILDLNPDTKKGIKADMILVIPDNYSKPTITLFKTSPEKHEVKQNETLYGISKQYGLTVDDLKTANPILETQNLNIGQNLEIPRTKEVQIPINIISKNAKVIAKTSPKSINYINYEIQAKETLFGLSKKFNISIEDLISVNPQLSNGVQETMTIKVPEMNTLNNSKKSESVGIFKSKNAINTISKFSEVIKKTDNRNIKDLNQTLKTNEKKKLSLLLPFNVIKIQSDTLVSLSERIKKNKFLNMTIDFYSGAIMAIDSAKILGLNIDVTILDSQEDKTSSNVENLVNNGYLRNMNAIIGPFYQNQVDKLAKMLENNNVAIISPLSKEVGKPFKNSFSSMPSTNSMKVAIFDYMNKKNANIIVVIDNKKTTLKQFIIESQVGIKFTEFDEKGIISTENLKSLLVRDKLNFVIFASENTSTIISVTNTLISALANYQIRLVILEPNPTFDNDAIDINKLAKLNLTYPSLTREIETIDSKIFEKEFKKRNRINPNVYAIRGFDITFDTMLRLSNKQSFKDLATNFVTERVENKFDYRPRLDSGYENKGVFILQYNSDLTVTEAE